VPAGLLVTALRLVPAGLLVPALRLISAARLIPAVRPVPVRAEPLSGPVLRPESGWRTGSGLRAEPLLAAEAWLRLEAGRPGEAWLGGREVAGTRGALSRRHRIPLSLGAEAALRAPSAEVGGRLALVSAV
jgi:hypothetical protein